MLLNALSRSANINNSNIQQQKINYTSFRGNDSFEKSKSNGIGTVIHETHFFREPKTDEFVLKYILDNFKNEDKIKIVSGACSTGEEALSYSMLLDEIKDKTEITGFDIDEKSISQAKNGIYKVKNIVQTINSWDTPKNQEGFLLDETLELTEYQKQAKEKFYKYFSPISEKKFEKIGLGTRITDDIANCFFKIKGISEKIQPRKTETQLFQTNAGAFENCSFMQGDILNTSKMFKRESINVFLFRNALYHIVCTGNEMMRFMNPNSEDVIKNIAVQIYDCLKPDGLLVFGEDESTQGIDKDKLYDILTEQGFIPIDIDEKETKAEQEMLQRMGITNVNMHKQKVNMWKKPSE